MGATAGLMGLNAAQTINTVSRQRAQASAYVQQGEYSAAANEQNARLAELQAADTISRGVASADMRAAQGRQQAGQAKAALAGQGVDVGTGSAAAEGGNIARLSALDEATIRNNAAREAWGFTTQAKEYRQQGALAMAAGKRAAAGEGEDEVSTLLTGAGKTYGLYRNRSKDLGT